jgi:hypothetical protein
MPEETPSRQIGPIRAITRRYAIICHSDPFEGMFDAVIDLASGHMVVSRVVQGTLTGTVHSCRTLSDIFALFGGKSIVITPGSYQDERGDTIPDLVAFTKPDAVETKVDPMVLLTISCPRLHNYMSHLLDAGMSDEQVLMLGYDFAYTESSSEVDYNSLRAAEMAAAKLEQVARRLGITRWQQQQVLERASL